MILHIIGLILKIIGIILLVILGILLLLIGILLFAPIRYELNAAFPGKLEEAKGCLRISWLFHLVSGRVVYQDGDVKWQGRIAWKKLGDASETEEKPKKKSDDREHGGEKAVGKKTVGKNDVAEMEKPQKTPKKRKEAGMDAKPERLDVKTELPRSENKKNVPDAKLKLNAQESSDRKEKTGKTPRKRKKPVKAFGKLIRKLSQKLREILEKIKCTWKNLCDKIKNIADKKDKILEFLEQENHKAAFARGKKELVWVKRFLKPKKLRVKLHFGFEDPYHTGQVLALCGMLYAFVGENMDLEPDFEKRVLDGTVYIKGRIRAVHMAIFAVKLLLDKNIRSTYHDIREFKW